MNNNFDELILKRRARGRARMASMGAHGGHARLLGRERGARMSCGARTPRGARTGARTPCGVRTAEGAHGEGVHAAKGRPRQRGAPSQGARTCTPPIGGAYEARTAASHVVGGGANVRTLQWGRARLK
jgi:hypothetical protein